MATQEEILAEIKRRGLKTPKQRAIEAEIARRGLTVPGGILGDAARRKQIEAETASDQQTDTRAVQELPEIGFSGLLRGEDPLTVAKIASALAVTTDPREMGNILTSTLPHIGITEDEQGNLLASNNRNGVQTVINKPGASPIDLIQGVSTAAAFTPAASVTGGMGTTAPRVIAGMGTAGLTQTAIESLQEQLGGEMDADEIAIATALGGAAEVVLPAINAYRNARQAKQADLATNLPLSQMEEAAPAVQQAQEATGAIKNITGEEVGLFPAQQTLIPAEVLKIRVLPQLEAGSRTALNNLNRQNEQAHNATVKLIDAMLPEVNSGAPMKLKTAAQRAIDAQKEVRKEAAKFGEAISASDALDLGRDVNIGRIQTMLDDLFEESTQGGPLETMVNTFRRRLTPREGRDYLTYQQLQRAKKEMDDKINKSPVSPDAPDPSIKGKIMELKKALVEEMNAASPAYKKASEVFAEQSPAVEQLQASMIGRIANVSDKQLKNIAAEIFNPRTTAKDITRTRQVIESVDPSAWQSIVRNELDFRVGSVTTAISEQGADAVANLPALLKREIFGPAGGRKREVLLRSMTKQQRENFKYLETVLSRASVGRVTNSLTAEKGAFIRELRGRLGVFKDVLTMPIKTIQETGDASLFNRNVRAITEIMFNPKWQPRLNEIRSLPNNSPAAARAMAQLVDDAMPSVMESMGEQQEEINTRVEESISDVREQANR
jgi:hypothetical protein